MSRKKYYTKEDMNWRMIRYFRSKEYWRMKFKDLVKRCKKAEIERKNLKVLDNKRLRNKIERLEKELKIVTRLYQKFNPCIRSSDNKSYTKEKEVKNGNKTRRD